MIKFLLVLLMFIGFPAMHAQNTLNLMPVPKKMEVGTGKFRLDTAFTISVRAPEDGRAWKAANRFLRRLSDRTGLFFKQDIITPKSSALGAHCEFVCNQTAELKPGSNESYTLRIVKSGITLHAPTDFGILRGMETILQLISADDQGFYLPEITIEDEPRFTWRGLMMDVSRHFMPVDVIKRNLDGMAAVKMNVFHWHLSDDQGFRVECKTFPKLHLLASDGFYYTQEQIRDVIQYADERGIRVVPEFDIPGHSTSWLTAYPELASAPGPYSIERNWGVFDPTFDPTKEETYNFFNDFFKEICSLFPDAYVHIGGDENNGKQWNENSQIQRFMKENNIADNHALQAYFNKRILQILTRYNKQMLGWDEILHEDMPKSIMIQSWRGVGYLEKSAKLGFSGILSNGYYIDLIHPASDHYLVDPLPDTLNLNEEQKARILGGEATMWAELVTSETVDSRIWPRTAAIAERFWSPSTVRDVDDMYRRLSIIEQQLEEHGLLHCKNYEMMLRRLTLNNDITPLKILVDVLEPVKGYTRHNQGVKYTSFSPYTRIVDAARPDANAKRVFSSLIEKYISGDASAKSELTAYLIALKENYNALQPLFRLAPAIREIEPMAQNLKGISDVSLRLMAMKENKIRPDSEVIKDAEKYFSELKKPYGQVECALIKGFDKLLKYTLK